MTDLSAEVQKALYAKLSAVEGIPQVASAVPIGADDQAEYPFVLIGDDDVSDIGSKGDPLWRHEARVQTWMQSTTPYMVKQVIGFIHDALQDQPIAVDGAQLSAPTLLSQNLSLADDGATWIATQTFLIFAQAE